MEYCINQWPHIAYMGSGNPGKQMPCESKHPKFLESWGIFKQILNIERPTVPNRTPRSSQAASDATSAATSILTYLKWEKKRKTAASDLLCFTLALDFSFSCAEHHVHPKNTRFQPWADLISKRVSPWLFSLVSHKPYLPYLF